jgi:hypothetical protein
MEPEASTSLLLPHQTHKQSLSVLIRETPFPSPGDDDEQRELPLVAPLEHSQFEGDDWDASTFLLERRHTGLDELRSDVRLLPFLLLHPGD